MKIFKKHEGEPLFRIKRSKHKTELLERENELLKNANKKLKNLLDQHEEKLEHYVSVIDRLCKEDENRKNHAKKMAKEIREVWEKIKHEEKGDIDNLH